MVCIILKPMSVYGIAALKNKFLRCNTINRHHCRGHPYIIYKICFA
ncbi:MAG: hypothetical protein MJZ08_05450 [Bacteroidaceae bacterium]|nr:hypothetical protein [Bacteroidaceae bacterium]